MKNLKSTSPLMFDRIAKRYDFINRVLSCGIDIYWRRFLIKEIPSGEIRLLDIACGTGDQLFSILQKRKNIALAKGIDLSTGMLEVAKKKGAADSFLVGDAKALPFEEKSFDAATISFGIRNIDEPLVALKEMHRILSPKGRALILEFSLPSSRLIAPLYLFYLRHILPFIGNFLSKDKEAYSYLSKTIESFPYGIDFVNLMKEAGFTQATSKPLSFGIATLYVGVK